jgi:hypothetical protein
MISSANGLCDFGNLCCGGSQPVTSFSISVRNCLLLTVLNDYTESGRGSQALEFNFEKQYSGDVPHQKGAQVSHLFF